MFSPCFRPQPISCFLRKTCPLFYPFIHYRERSPYFSSLLSLYSIPHSFIFGTSQLWSRQMFGILTASALPTPPPPPTPLPQNHNSSVVNRFSTLSQPYSDALIISNNTNFKHFFFGLLRRRCFCSSRIHSLSSSHIPSPSFLRGGGMRDELKERMRRRTLLFTIVFFFLSLLLS